MATNLVYSSISPRDRLAPPGTRMAATRPFSLLARAAKTLKERPDGVGDVGEFQGDAQVRLVGAEAVHGFGVGHARKGVGQIDGIRAS